MNNIKSKSRSITFLSILIVGAFLGTTVGGAMLIPGEASADTGNLTTTAPAYTIYKDASGYTCALNGVTSIIDFRDTNSRTVIQQAIDKTTGGCILIKAGTYNIPTTIYTSVTSITGEGNATILRVSGPNRQRGHHGDQRLLQDGWNKGFREQLQPPDRNNHQQHADRR